jgi:hypothetical protein
MMKSTKIKFGLFVKLLAFSMLAFAVTFFSIYFFDKATGTKIFDPVAILILGISSLLTPFLIWILSPPKEKSRKPFSRLEHEFNKEGDRLVINNFGDKTFEKIFMDEQNIMPIDGIEVCQNLLENPLSLKKDIIRMHLLYRLSNNYYRNGQYESAAKSIKSALKIEPMNLLLNLVAAEFFEYIGQKHEVIKHYENALFNTKELTPDLKKFVLSRMKKIEAEGLQKREPPSGKKWMTG